MDKVDLCLIPFIYLLRLTLNILSVVILLMPTPANLGKVIQNGIPWMAIISLHTTTLPINQFYLLNLMNGYPTFLVIILAMFHVRSPSTTRSLEWNGAIWIVLTCMTSILFVLSAFAQTDTDNDSKGRTEFCTSTFFSATLPFLAQVLL